MIFVDCYFRPNQTPKNAEIIFQKSFYTKTNGAYVENIFQQKNILLWNKQNLTQNKVLPFLLACVDQINYERINTSIIWG
jgi:hypothetical protein